MEWNSHLLYKYGRACIKPSDVQKGGGGKEVVVTAPISFFSVSEAETFSTCSFILENISIYRHRGEGGAGGL